MTKTKVDTIIMSLNPLEVIAEKVSPIDVGKYYLKIELSKLFAADELRTSIDKSIDELNEYDFWRLLEALSLIPLKRNILGN